MTTEVARKTSEIYATTIFQTLQIVVYTQAITFSPIYK